MNTRTSLRLEDSDTEIVVVSDTVRQRRARTPQANDSNGESNVLPDLLPQTFRLTESSNLFSQVAGDTNEIDDNDDIIRPSVVEVKERDLSQLPIMSVALLNVAEIVDTVETVGSFIPEFVETVQVLDMSEDSDSSMRVDEDYVALRGDDNSLLKVEKQRISFEEKRKRIDKERDILRDSEEDLDMKSTPKKPKRLRQLFLDEEQRHNTSDTDETLVFSEDEDIPRFSLENSLAFESDSDTVVDFIQAFL